MKRTLLTALLLSTQLLLPIANADNAKAAFTSKEITKDLIFLQGKGGNIALSKGPDGLLIIDDDYAEMADALKKEIDRFGGVDKLKFILNTHWHGDHTQNNATFGKTTHIVAHENVRKRLSTRQEIPFFNMVSQPSPEHALPDLTYPQTMNIHFNNDTLTLEHYPNGHTDGDTIVFFDKANVVHMGDHMFYPMFPFVDISSGGNAVTFAANVGKVVKKIDAKTVVIPGHGPLTDKKGLVDFHNMLVGTIEEVKKMKTAGLSLKKAQGKGLSKQWKSWGGGFIKEPVWIGFIYESL